MRFATTVHEAIINYLHRPEHQSWFNLNTVEIMATDIEIFHIDYVNNGDTAVMH